MCISEIEHFVTTNNNSKKFARESKYKIQHYGKNEVKLTKGVYESG